MNYKLAGFIAAIALLYGCAESTPTTTNPQETGQGPSSSPTTTGSIPARLPGDVYYTGYVPGGVTDLDGNTVDFGITVSTSRSFAMYRNEDSAIASVSNASVTLDSALVQQLIDDYNTAHPDNQLTGNRLTRFQSRLTSAEAQKITPFNEGVAYILATRALDSRRNDPNDWYRSELRTVVVSKYTASQYQKGENRYKNGIAAVGGTACILCHGSQTGGAPSHLIGRVTRISDGDAIQWISTGSVGDRVADDPSANGHTWAFTDDDEKIGTVAYLRSLQTKDVSELTRLKFEEAIAADSGAQ